MDQVTLNNIVRVMINVDKVFLCHAHFCGVASEKQEVCKVMAARPWSLEEPPWWIQRDLRISPSQLKLIFAAEDKEILAMAPRGI